MVRHAVALAALAALAGCATAPPRQPTIAAPPRAPAAGLGRVMGQDARVLADLFGKPALDVREGPGRKLQWRGPACVLDTYLYPGEGGGELRVTWTDARTPAGADFDRASCVAALARR